MSDVKRYAYSPRLAKFICAEPMCFGVNTDFVTASDYDALVAANNHLRDELSSKTGATVDIGDTRYECHPAVAARLAEAERLLRETVNGYPMGAANDGGVFVNGGLTGEILVYFALHDEPLRATDSASEGPQA